MIKSFIKYIFLILFISANFLVCQKQGQERIDSLLSALPGIKNDSIRANILNFLAFEYLNIDLNVSRKYAEESLELSKSINYYNGQAEAYNNLGNYFDITSDIPKAFESYQQSLKVNEKMGDKRGAAGVLANMGNLFLNPSDYSKALEYFDKSLKIFEDIDDKTGIAMIACNMGSIYYDLADYPKTLKYYQKALKLYKDLGNNNGISIVLGNIAGVNLNLSNYTQALENYRQALEMDLLLGNKKGIATNLANLGSFYFLITQDTVLPKIHENSNLFGLNKKSNLENSVAYSLKALKIANDIGSKELLIAIFDNLREAYQEKGDFKNAYEYHVKWSKLKDSVFSIEKAKEIAKLEAKKDKEVAEEELKVQKLENTKAKNESYVLWGGIAFLGLVIVIIYRQRRASEQLLLNILPAKIAARLKQKEKYIADKFPEASVIFIDQVAFTIRSADAQPEEVVAELDEIYTKFDKLADKYGLEKIKTIGDCYMAAAGIPEPRENHAESAAMFALEAMEISNELVSFRCGIDCGPVIGGVIGRKKFIYDLWGDTVNTASRMESNGEPGRIQVSERFKEKIEIIGLKSGMVFAKRGEMEIKGKGLMTTWFLEKSL